MPSTQDLVKNLQKNPRDPAALQAVKRHMLEKRRYAREHLDHLRRALMLEPRGHADMYGCVLTAPVNDDGDVGSSAWSWWASSAA